ncbi:hypothetical protein F4780DRAFT_61039 [Xylariomycetidae sp. FL0641]|nr:hypothetical protein F4780DRAFT_61039 [Xylariomycetidae sp. FL0641]
MTSAMPPQTRQRTAAAKDGDALVQPLPGNAPPSEAEASAPYATHDPAANTVDATGPTTPQTPQTRCCGSQYIPPSGASSAPSPRLSTRPGTGIQSLSNLSTPSDSPAGLRARLLEASSKSHQVGTSHVLEESPDIEYNVTKDEDTGVTNPKKPTEVGENEPNGTRNAFISDASKSDKPALVNTEFRRSARISARNQVLVGPLHKSLSEETSIRKRKSTNGPTETRKYPRRSARLSKPLTKFQKFPDLPVELKLMVFEAAIEPRVVYLCNRKAAIHSGPPFNGMPIVIHNHRPTWFMASHESVYVAERNYQAAFAMTDRHTGEIDSTLRQPVNFDRDIVMYEPCHSGCRALYCARQYSDEDRAKVRFLAVQADSPLRSPFTHPGWVTISRSWPNVEVLYFVFGPFGCPRSGETAIIRIGENAQKVHVRHHFDLWKKGPGKACSMHTLEFVIAAPREFGKDIKDLYKGISQRKTGDPEDIIFG